MHIYNIIFVFPRKGCRFLQTLMQIGNQLNFLLDVSNLYKSMIQLYYLKFITTKRNYRRIVLLDINYIILKYD